MLSCCRLQVRASQFAKFRELMDLLVSDLWQKSLQGNQDSLSLHSTWINRPVIFSRCIKMGCSSSGGTMPVPELGIKRSTTQAKSLYKTDSKVKLPLYPGTTITTPELLLSQMPIVLSGILKQTKISVLAKILYQQTLKVKRLSSSWLGSRTTSPFQTLTIPKPGAMSF